MKRILVIFGLIFLIALNIVGWSQVDQLAKTRTQAIKEGTTYRELENKDRWAEFSDKEIVAVVMLLEARGETKYKGMAAVGQVIKNRVDFCIRGKTAREVCLAKKQFAITVVKKTNESIRGLLKTKEGKLASSYAKKILEKKDIDKRVSGKYIYFCTYRASWMKRGLKKIGNHYFAEF